MAITKKAPVVGTINFIQHNLPGLDAGAYMVKVSQTVSTQPTAPLDNTYYFAVEGPRFALNPDDINTTYPPDLAEGEFNNTLPHVVLVTQTLPWIRYPTINEPPREFEDGKHERDVPTWLGVLLFDGNDETAHPGFRAQARAGTVRDLFIKRTDANPAQGYSYFYNAKDLGPDSDSAALAAHLEYGQKPDDACQLIDVPLALFWKIAPSCDDLKVSAHLRNVNITKKATQNGVPAGRNDLSAIPGTSNFALVMGNRKPQAGVRTFAHLVSLEGLAPFLPNDPATKDDSGEVTNPTKVVAGDTFNISPGGFMRLVSLKSWSFTSVGDNSHFEQLLMKLEPKDPLRAGEDVSAAPHDFSIGLPVPPANVADLVSAKRAKNALAMGYTALRHRTRDGGQTVSWYRGPLLPYRVETNVLPDTLSSSDAATLFDPDSGMFDVGYAGAWQIGRLLALRDKHYSVLLYNWRRENLRDNVARMEALALGQTLDDIQQQLRDDDLIYPLLKVFLPESGAAGQTAALAHGRVRRADTHRAMLTDTATITDLMKDQLATPREIYTWLAKLKLLDGVPFNYLVPDERMLPPESIRFFYLDMNWVDALLDGALSIGRYAAKSAPSLEAAHDAAAKPIVHAVSSSHARTLRPAALGVSAPAPAPLEAVSGFLLRSEVVKGWPGLEVNGYADDGTLMDIVRFERLAPTVLLCLFEKDGKTLSEVDIHEPAEGLHFGLADDSPPTVNIRYNHAVGKIDPGTQVPNVKQPVPFREKAGDANKRVVRMFRLSKAMNDPKYGTYITDVYTGFDHLPSSQFAMQMLKGVGMVSFNFGARTS